MIEKIKEIIRRYFEKNRANKLRTEGKEEIKKLIWRQGGYWKDYKEQINFLIKQVEHEMFIEFKAGFGKNIENTIKSELNKIINYNRNYLSTKANIAQKIIAKALEYDAINGDNWEEIVRKALRKLKFEERHIKTEIETTKAALNNLKRFKDFTDEEIGNLYLRYDGPQPERDFCRRHYQKVYSIQEVKELINDFGQPAFTYCGGYNCRHRWVPVLKE